LIIKRPTKGKKEKLYVKRLTLYNKNATNEAKIKLIIPLINPTNKTETAHSHKVNGETKRLTKFLFQSSSSKFTVISYCPQPNQKPKNNPGDNQQNHG